MRQKTGRTMPRVLLALMLTLGLMLTQAAPARADSVDYYERSWNGSAVESVKKTISNFQTLSKTQGLLPAGMLYTTAI